MPSSAHAEVAGELLTRLNEAIEDGATAQTLAGDSYKLIEAVRAIDLRGADAFTTRYLYAGALEVESALRSESSPATLRAAFEKIRQALERLEEQEALADSRPLADVVDWTVSALRLTNNQQLADMLGVAGSTVGRWRDRDSAPAVETEEMSRVRRLARVVRQLRHVLTASGTVTWLTSPNEALGGRKPVELLIDEESFEPLLHLASRGRSQVAS